MGLGAERRRWGSTHDGFDGRVGGEELWLLSRNWRGQKPGRDVGTGEARSCAMLEELAGVGV